MALSREPQSAPIDLRDLAWRARRYRLLPLVPFVTVVCAALIYLKITKPLYESYVVVDMGDQPAVSSAIEPLVRPERQSGDFRANVERLNNRIHSRNFLNLLVDRLGLGRSPEALLAASAVVKRWQGISPQEYAQRMATTSIARKILVSAAAQGQIRIAAVDSDPRFAQRLASAIADAIIEEGKQSALERVRARGEFSADQAAVYEERLHKSEAALRNFQETASRRRVTSNVVNDQNLNEARNLIQLTDAEMDQIRDRIRTDLGEWASRFGGSRDVPELRSPRASELESRLTALEISHGTTSLQIKTTPGADDAAGLAAKIGTLRQEIHSEYKAVARALGNDRTDAAVDLAAGIALDRSELRSLQAKRKRLSEFVTTYTRAVETAPQNQMELERLQSEVSANRDLLLALRREATSSRISEALETSHLGLRLEVIEPPQLPLLPVKPNKMKVMIVALLLGPVLSVGLILGAERVGAVLRTSEQAEQEFGIKVIGTVPRIEGWTRPESYLMKYGALLSIVLVVLVTMVFYTLPSDTFSGRPPSNRPGAAP
ncbi:MAG: hypothetical protein HY568_00045 [Candidatus Latescibacteria bacterium]|nr:hypothetical protein [Candidatus Latescibacterota bacterium]